MYHPASAVERSDPNEDDAPPPRVAAGEGRPGDEGGLEDRLAAVEVASDPLDRRAGSAEAALGEAEPGRDGQRETVERRLGRHRARK
jgi:hypothetical protein